VEREHKLGRPVTGKIGELPEMSLRQTAMRRAIANLVDNALRYAGGEVDVIARRETHSSGDEAIVEVMDRGPGIPESERERMKQPFARLEQARSGAGGSGLGLAIVDRIAHAHNGRFELSAREGGGLVARIRLPLG
jgi:two-component system osmolarity sensor histidine kinase EnvZ